MSTQQPWPKPYVHTGSGAASSGYKLFTYEAGTSTKKPTYKDSGNVTAQSNPIILNSRGEPDSPIYYDTSAGIYKLVMSPNTDTDPPSAPIWSVDNYGETPATGISLGSSLIPNGSFELDVDSNGVADGWVQSMPSGGSISLDSTDQSHGNISLKGVSTGLGGGFYVLEDMIPVAPTESYTIAFDIKSTANVTNIVSFNWLDANRMAISQTVIYNESIANPTAWTNKSGSATPPAAARYATIQFNLCDPSNANPGTCRIDNVVVFITPAVAPLVHTKNVIINGNPSINQRTYVSGTATTVANQYTLDRWRVVTSGQALTFSNVANEVTLTLPVGGIEQVIEGLNIQSGTYTISFVATGDTVCTVDGTVKAGGDTFTLTGGTNATIKFSSAGGAGTVKLIQVEFGTSATDFEYRDRGLELAMCQRYYRELGEGLRSSRTSATLVLITTIFEPPMRVAPTVTLLDTSIQLIVRDSIIISTGSSIQSSILKANAISLQITGWADVTSIGAAWDQPNFLAVSSEL